MNPLDTFLSNLQALRSQLATLPVAAQQSLEGPVERLLEQTTECRDGQGTSLSYQQLVDLLGEQTATITYAQGRKQFIHSTLATANSLMLSHGDGRTTIIPQESPIGIDAWGNIKVKGIDAQLNCYYQRNQAEILEWCEP